MHLTGVLHLIDEAGIPRGPLDDADRVLVRTVRGRTWHLDSKGTTALLGAPTAAGCSGSNKQAAEHRTVSLTEVAREELDMCEREDCSTHSESDQYLRYAKALAEAYLLTVASLASGDISSALTSLSGLDGQISRLDRTILLQQEDADEDPGLRPPRDSLLALLAYSRGLSSSMGASLRAVGGQPGALDRFAACEVNVRRVELVGSLSYQQSCRALADWQTAMTTGRGRQTARNTVLAQSDGPQQDLNLLCDHLEQQLDAVIASTDSAPHNVLVASSLDSTLSDLRWEFPYWQRGSRHALAVPDLVLDRVIEKRASAKLAGRLSAAEDADELIPALLSLWDPYSYDLDGDAAEALSVARCLR